ncbi:glycosyltransferase [Neobacillus sp. 179-J 1A1 HS]|uniref:glycosyltransferase n=1 Tax=Neobacillus driksii TaxID=3035913 RepID=UPI0035BC3312
MRVLHIIPGYGGGISSYVLNLLKSLQYEENICIDIASYSDYPDEIIALVEKKGGKCQKLPSVHRGFRKFWKMYLQILRNGGYDMVHCHISGIKGLPFTAGASLIGINRIVIHAHSANDESSFKLKRIIGILNRFSNMLFLTNRVSCGKMASVFTFGPRIVKTREIVYMPNVVDIRAFLKVEKNNMQDQLRKQLKIPSNTTIIGHIGRFNPVKNHLFMIDIIKSLVNNGLNFVWIFVGDGALLQEFKNKITQNNLEQYVRILGRREDIEQILYLVDVIVLPSFFEGVPTVAIEAQAAGKPVVLSDTITNEADMGMDLLEYLPLSHSAEVWAFEIMKKSGIDVVDFNERCSILEEKGYTLNGLATNYQAFVYSK